MISAKSLESGNAVLQTIHASEGGRALKLLKQRHKRQQELEQIKTEIEKENRKRRLGPIDEKYKGSFTEVFEEEFKQDTVGLVTAEQFREKRKRLTEKIENTQKLHDEKLQKDSLLLKEAERRKTKTLRLKLSFSVDSDEGSNEDESDSSDEMTAKQKKKYFGKDPSVDTSFLSDPQREEKLLSERESLIQRYLAEQEQIKEEFVELSYQYWDGIGHKGTLVVKKGSTIGSFVNDCRKNLEKEFFELRTISTDNLLYVKGDAILPHSLTFYDIIKIQVVGKAKNLISLSSTKKKNKFPTHAAPDQQMVVETQKDESFTAKIVDRRWYEKNKHIFPASKWEPYHLNKESYK